MLLQSEYELIGDIYDASLEPARWAAVLRRFAELGEARTAIIIATDVLNPASNLIIPHNLPEASLIEYREKKLDVIDMEVTGGGLMRRGIGIADCSHGPYGSFENWKSRIGDFYPFLKKWGASSQAAAVLEQGHYRWSVVGVHRPEESGFFGDRSLDFINRMVPHLRRSLQIHRQFNFMQHENSALYQLIETLASGVVLLDEEARVSYCNERARELLRQHGALRLGGYDRLRAGNAAQDGELQSLIRGAIQTSRRDCHGETGGVIGLRRGDEKAPLMLSVLPLSATSLVMEKQPKNIAAAVFITDPACGHALPRQALRTSWQLGEREIDLCVAFVNRPALEDVADTLGISLATARTYLKSIYAKTGQKSQTELTRFLLALAIDFEHIG